SGGLIEAVGEDEIFDAYRDVVRLAGIFCEPASAASLAGVRKLRLAGRLDADALVVCVLTGHGLKDPDTAGRLADPLVTAAPTLPAVMEALGWHF
ncbi:MAG TPA: pyridoxal-phosphate dependent enzyme, partial [Candidatus Limnocylindrales bacterium]